MADEELRRLAEPSDWWYLDAVPSHAWNRWRYHYPHAEFPYAKLAAQNGRRGRGDPEYELFEQDRFWSVDVTYAKASAAWYSLSIAPGSTVELRLRLRPTASSSDPETALGTDFDRVMAARRAEADDFHAELTPPDATGDEAMAMRQAFARLLWSKQLYASRTPASTKAPAR